MAEFCETAESDEKKEDTDKEGETALALQIAMGYTLLLGTLNTYHFQVSNHEFFVSKHPITVSRICGFSSFDHRVFREALQFLGIRHFCCLCMKFNPAQLLIRE